MTCEYVTGLCHRIPRGDADRADWAEVFASADPGAPTLLEHPGETRRRLGYAGPELWLPRELAVWYPLDEGDVLTSMYAAFAFGWCDEPDARS